MCVRTLRSGRDRGEVAVSRKERKRGGRTERQIRRMLSATSIQPLALCCASGFLGRQVFPPDVIGLGLGLGVGSYSMPLPRPGSRSYDPNPSPNPPLNRCHLPFHNPSPHNSAHSLLPNPHGCGHMQGGEMLPHDEPLSIRPNGAHQPQQTAKIPTPTRTFTATLTLTRAPTLTPTSNLNRDSESGALPNQAMVPYPWSTGRTMVTRRDVIILLTQK